MKRIVIALNLVATLLLVACSPKSGNTTKVVGQFAENAPETIEIEIQGEKTVLDTTVAVVDGRFEVEIPKLATTWSLFKSGSNMITFISDGSTITIDPEAGTAVSSDADGPHSRNMVFSNRWNDYQTKIAECGNDVEAIEKCRNENIGALTDFTKEAAQNNPDNIVGLQALQMLYLYRLDVSPEEMLSMVNGLSDEMKNSPVSFMVSELLNRFDGLVKSAEGKPFVDFTVVQDPENPETSTVKLSDYVGKGKYLLVDFWASWCVPCRAAMPYLIDVYNTYHGDKFDMLSIAVGDKVEDTVKAASELGLIWNQIINAQQIPIDPYGISEIPTLILFGPDGTILKRGIEVEQLDEVVKEALAV